MNFIKTFLRLFFVSTLFLSLHSDFTEAMAQKYHVTVWAGDYDRVEAVVSFPTPDDFAPGIYKMITDSKKEEIVQVDENQEAWFILQNLSAGASVNYTLSADSRLESPDENNVQYDMNKNRITFRTGDKEIFSYFYRNNNPPVELDGRYKRGGYIHPVYSPKGVLLSNHLNVNLHPHHLGIWSAWTKTEFRGGNPDFWNFQDNSGKVESSDSLYAAWEGPVYGGFLAQHYFQDLTQKSPVTALNEQWEVRVFPALDKGNYFIFDLLITQTANTSEPLKLLEYHYGGLGFRGHEDWDNPDNISFLTSEGFERDGNATRARWVHIGGYSDGNLAGISIMNHPDNFRHPQPIRIHPDMAFFNYAPAQSGDFSIEPGSPYKAQYRFITYDDEPKSDELNRLWKNYSLPPKVVVRSE